MKTLSGVAKPYFDPVIIGDQTFDFSHLQPFTMDIESALAKKALSVHVTFSNHCFTKTFDQASHVPGDPIFDEYSVRPRSFCPIRYNLSFALPEIITSLNHPKAKVWESTAERNWAYTIKIENPAGPYHLFFEVRRANQKPQDLNLVVESAYHQDPERDAPRLRGSMNFLLLCGKVYLRLPTATKR